MGWGDDMEENWKEIERLGREHYEQQRIRQEKEDKRKKEERDWYYRHNYGGGSDPGTGCGCLGCTIVFLAFLLIFTNFASFVSILFYPLYRDYVLPIWGPIAVTFYLPEGNGYEKEYYKMSAMDYANNNVEQLQTANWESKDFTVFNKGNRYWKLNEIRRDWLDGKYWSGYENQKVVNIHKPSRSYRIATTMVEYERDKTYCVKTELPVDFIAVDAKGKSGDIYAATKYEYTTILTCEPKRTFYGTVDMGWKVSSVDLVTVTVPEEKILALSDD